jgi:DNA-binding GntR family transcriptional regulator
MARETDLHPEIPSHAQLRAIIEDQLQRDAYRVGDHLRGVRVRRVGVGIGEAKLLELPVRSPVLEIRTVEHDVEGQVVWCSTNFYSGADVCL